MLVNTEVKGNLAKLLATENLTIEHRKITTAYFDVERRILALPIWKEVTGDVYDLLVGHEVGHALYTPNEDWGDAPKDFVNVLEDARVERRMKITYPGLRKSFYRGYSELNAQDFFGIADRDLSNLSLIDRINLHFKVGIVDSVAVPFSEDELQWVERANKTSNFKEVVQLAEEIYNLAEQKEQEKIDNIETPPNMTGTGDQQEDTEYNPTSESQETGDEKGDASEPDIDAYGDDYEDVSASYSETECITEQAWKSNQHQLLDDNAKEWIYIKTPEVHLDNIIVPWKKINSDLQQKFDSLSTVLNWSGQSVVEWTFSKYQDYKKSAVPSVNHLVKQFEMKKRASAYHRQQSSKTGVIDTNKLHSYKYSEDIFKRVNVLPDGKSHGLIMYLDWSGSMGDCILDTMKQLYNLIWFCRKVQIPFRVYAFYAADGYNEKDVQVREENTIRMNKSFRLFEFFSSRMNARTLENQMKLVWAQAYSCSSGYHHHGGHACYGLGSTPLVEVACTTPKLVKRFLAEEKIQKVNIVTLTDGESNPIQVNLDSVNGEDEYMRKTHICHNTHKVWILRDRYSSYSRRISPSPYDTTKEIFSFFNEITDYNFIGIRLCSKGELSGMLRNLIHSVAETDAILKDWQNKRFAKIKNFSGFTEFFAMPNKYIGGGTESLQVNAKGTEPTRAELQRAFKKHMGSKMTNKTLLNAFVEQIV